MISLHLKPNSPEEEAIYGYLQNNASETLAQKINAGVSITREDKQLINKKDLNGFMAFASEEAKKIASKGARYACIKDEVVFGWAIHYFEEDSIIGTLYTLDGEKYEAPQTAPIQTTPKCTPVKKKEDNWQMSFLDNLEDDKSETNEVATGKREYVTEDGEIIDLNDDNEEIEEEDKEEPEIAYRQPEAAKGTDLYQRYERIQSAYPTSIIAIRMGDFYEIFGEFAITLGNELDLTLSSRDLGLETRIPIIGFPYHRADRYFSAINKAYGLVIIENSTDEDNKYLPQNSLYSGEFATNKDDITEKIKAVFGKDLEVF